MIPRYKGISKGSLAFMQQFKLVNWWFRFLMSRTGYLSGPNNIPNQKIEIGGI